MNFAAALQDLQLTSEDVWNIISHIVTIGLIVVTAVWLDGYRSKIERSNTLDDWVRKARFERESKEHKVLSKASPADMRLLSACETRKLVLDGKLDPKENVIFISKRCHELASHKQGVNAIAEELYDEVNLHQNVDCFPWHTRHLSLKLLHFCSPIASRPTNQPARWTYPAILPALHLPCSGFQFL